MINDGTSIRIGKPVIEDVQKDGEVRPKPLFPNEARLRNLTYSAMLYADVAVECTRIRVDPETYTPLDVEDILSYQADEIDSQFTTGDTTDLGIHYTQFPVEAEEGTSYPHIYKIFHNVPI